MKRTLIAIALLVVGGTLAAQGTTYNQTNRVCIIAECVDATFAPTASLSYTDNLQHASFDLEPFTGTATWNGTTYEDFAGALSGVFGRGTSCPYPFACYTLQGTFNAGHETVTEHWQCFRTCGPAQNISGSVVVQ